MKKYTKNKHSKKIVSAKLLQKKESEYYSIPGKDPYPKKIYELEFCIGDSKVIFEVSKFEFDVVEEGMKGKLKYQGYELLSFGNWIKEIDKKIYE